MMEKPRQHDHLLVDVRHRGQWQVAGLYLLETRGFLYHKDYDGPPIDPVHLDYRAEGRRFPHAGGDLGDGSLPNVLRGLLPGRFAESQVVKRFPGYAKLSDAEKLLWIGEIERGGMRVRGNCLSKRDWPRIEGHKMLARIQEEALRSFRQRHLPSDWALGSFIAGEAGVRPKATARLRLDPEGPPREYIVKFNAEGDLFNMARVEHFTHELAHRCGVSSVRSQVRQIEGQDALFMERYDLDGEGRHRLRVAAADLLDIENERLGSGGDYLDLLDLVRRIAPDQVEDLFRQMVFHAAINNTDNHLRNFEFLFDEAEGRWRLAPNYDAIPDPDANHSATSFCRYPRREVSLVFIERLASSFGVDPALARPVLEAVAEHTEALLADLTPNDRDRVLQAVQPDHWGEVARMLPETMNRIEMASLEFR